MSGAAEHDRSPCGVAAAARTLAVAFVHPTGERTVCTKQVPRSQARVVGPHGALAHVRAIPSDSSSSRAQHATRTRVRCLVCTLGACRLRTPPLTAPDRKTRPQSARPLQTQP